MNLGALTGVTTLGASGTITAGADPNDGAATYDAGTISSGVAAILVVLFQGGSPTDGTATISGSLTGGVAGTFSGNVTAGRSQRWNNGNYSGTIQVQTILLQVELSQFGPLMMAPTCNCFC